MSEPTSDTGPSTDTSSDADTTTSGRRGSGGGDADDRLIPDEKLPDDLNPEKNPLAREPDDEAEQGLSPNGPDPAAGAPGG